MKIDGMLGGSFDGIGDRGAAALEALGYDGGVTAETSHDPFLPLVLAAAEHRAAGARHRDRDRVRRARR